MIVNWTTAPEPVSRSLSMSLTLALAMACWILVGAVARWLLG